MPELKKSKWKKILRHQQKPGWCGPAVIQMVFAAAGMRKSQKEIAHDVYQKWWGTTQQTILAYLSQFFKIVNFKQNATTVDISQHLDSGHVIIVNWWDDIDKSEDPDGHYSLVLKYDKETKKVTLGDPATGRGIWKMKARDFNFHWYDYLDTNNRTWIEGWMLWVDPKSKISADEKK